MEIAIKVDVDTARGTKDGVPKLADLFLKNDIPATFLFSLGPDNTGRAIKRIFRRGFLQKVSRTSVLQVYGLRTLGNGILWPGPHIGRKHGATLRQVATQGFEVGIHCYDHIRWQDNLHNMTPSEVTREFTKACDAFRDVFGQPATTAGAAGWQASCSSLHAYDEANLLYASDARGHSPFFPVIDGTRFATLQIPTTLPTLDELLGRPEYPISDLHHFYCQQLDTEKLNVLTIHAELEGMRFYDWFDGLIQAFKAANVSFVNLADVARFCLKNPSQIPHHTLAQGTVDGRSGTLAVQWP
ncbi:MAG: polysaccharide deacetylase family protein [Alphaproteobacteria bacterium]